MSENKEISFRIWVIAHLQKTTMNQGELATRIGLSHSAVSELINNSRGRLDGKPARQHVLRMILCFHQDGVLTTVGDANMGLTLANKDKLRLGLTDLDNDLLEMLEQNVTDDNKGVLSHQNKGVRRSPMLTQQHILILILVSFGFMAVFWLTRQIISTGDPIVSTESAILSDENDLASSPTPKLTLTEATGEIFSAESQITTPVKTAEEISLLQHSYWNDFSQYEAGSSPHDWNKLGSTSTIEPIIVEAQEEGRNFHVLKIPGLSEQPVDFDFILDGLTLQSAYTVTTKLQFNSEPADRAGIVIGWTPQGDIIRVQANIFWNHIDVWEIFEGALYKRTTSDSVLVVDVNKDYWLQVHGFKNSDDENQITVSWSTNGNDFIPILTLADVAHLDGQVGLTTSGPNLPDVYFDDFQVEYYGE